MMKKVTKLWKNSASLIVLVKNSKKRKSDYNYDCLMFKRTEKTSLFQKTYVFPGGIIDQTDESQGWLKLYESLGIPMEWFYVLTNITGPRPFIFQREAQNAIPREISLRITAFRETFEELGILLCKNKEQFHKKEQSTYSTYFDEFEIIKWQNLVHNDSSQFLKLCQELKVAPDLWNIYEWSDWLTPASFRPRRFETVFYITAIDSLPKTIHGEIHEVESYDLKDPTAFMNLYYKECIWLAPPQMYELARLQHQKKVEPIIDFARKRQPRGLTLFFPIIYQTKDKMVHIYPGDDLYPKDPDYDKQYDFDRFLEKTAEDLREGLEHIHRVETESLHGSKLYMNIEPPNEHLMPHNELYLASKL